MDKLKTLNTGQKLLLLVVVMGAIAGGFWHLMITEVEGQITAAKANGQKLQKDYSKLKEYEKKQRLEAVKLARAETEARLEANKKLLPPEEEIPTFIMGIKADADASGLEVIKFDPMESEIEDYYRMTPVKVEVMGKSKDVIDFLQTLASPRKMIVNVRELKMERLPMDEKAIQDAMGEESDFDQAARWKRKKKEEKDMTNEERRMLKLRRWQTANEMNRVRASFVAYTFSYTGEPMPDDMRKKRRRRRRG